MTPLHQPEADFFGNTTRSLSDLTIREREVLDLVATGLSNREVADSLSLAEKTVKHHMTSILRKLKVGNRVQAVLLLHDAHAFIKRTAPDYRDLENFVDVAD